MNAEEPQEREPASLVELQPLDHEPPPPRHLPVPEDPPQRCLQCDYNLTGLVSRRCPECGTPFKLQVPLPPPLPISKQDRVAIQSDHMAFRGGILLLITGTVVPMVVHRSGNGLSGPLPFGMAGCGVMILAAAFVYKSVFQRTWPEAMLLAGLSSTALAAIFIF